MHRYTQHAINGDASPGPKEDSRRRKGQKKRKTERNTSYQYVKKNSMQKKARVHPNICIQCMVSTCLGSHSV